MARSSSRAKGVAVRHGASLAHAADAAEAAAILVHIAYNGLTVLGERAAHDPDAANEWLTVHVLQTDWLAHAPWAAIPGLALLALVRRSGD